MSESRRIVVTVPDASFLPVLAGIDGVDARVWDLAGPAPAAAIDLLVAPHLGMPRPWREALAGVRVGLLQHPGIGYETLIGALPPGIPVANSAGVQELATAELAVTLALAMQRDLPSFVHAADRREWTQGFRPGLTDKRIMLLGYGGIGQTIERMLDGFEVEVVRVASRPRLTETGHRVYGVDELPALLPTVDIVLVAVPLSAATERLVDRTFLSRLPNGALVVNVSRGPVADTEAIVGEAAAGRLRFALDVTDPEPLPPGHELWSLPGVLVTPHVGGVTPSLRPRLERLIRDQAERLARGDAPRNLVFVSE